MHEDRKSLIDIENEIRQILAERRRPVTIQNVLHVMYGLPGEGVYADWLGGEDVWPTCELETRWQAFWRKLLGKCI
jgi:hypothetical protein